MQAQLLIDHYATHSMAEIGRMVGKSAACVAWKAKRLGLGSVQSHAAQATGGRTAPDIARIAGVSQTTVQNWAKAGCPHARAGASGHLIFQWREVMDWLAGQPFVFQNLPLHVRESMGVDFDEIPVSPLEAQIRLGIDGRKLRRWQRRGCPTVDVGVQTRCYVIRDVMAWALSVPDIAGRLPSSLAGRWSKRLRGAA